MVRWDKDDESRRFWESVDEASRSVESWPPERLEAARIAVFPDESTRRDVFDYSSVCPLYIGNTGMSHVDIAAAEVTLAQCIASGGCFGEGCKRKRAMVRKENRDAVRRLRDDQERIAEHRKRLEEVEFFGLLIQHYVMTVVMCSPQGRNDPFLGRLLIALRIAAGVSQLQLADRLGVHESQVSLDERNEYHGVTTDLAGRILEAILVELRSDRLGA